MESKSARFTLSLLEAEEILNTNYMCASLNDTGSYEGFRSDFLGVNNISGWNSQDKLAYDKHYKKSLT